MNGVLQGPSWPDRLALLSSAAQWNRRTNQLIKIQIEQVYFTFDRFHSICRAPAFSGPESRRGGSYTIETSRFEEKMKWKNLVSSSAKSCLPGQFLLRKLFIRKLIYPGLSCNKSQQGPHIFINIKKTEIGMMVCTYVNCSPKFYCWKMFIAPWSRHVFSFRLTGNILCSNCLSSRQQLRKGYIVEG